MKIKSLKCIDNDVVLCKMFSRGAIYPVHEVSDNGLVATVKDNLGHDRHVSLSALTFITKNVKAVPHKASFVIGI